MNSLLAVLFVMQAHAAAPLASAVLESAKPSDWRTVEQENLLYMDLPAGRVLIELAPPYAPKSITNVRALAHENYWDGLAVVRVQDGYVVQWADPNAEKPELRRKFKTASEKIPAELDVPLDKKLSFAKLQDPDTYAKATGFYNGFAAGHDAKAMWLLHCYGAVGIGRDNAPDSGNGSELYVVIGQAPRHLDRNVTVIGRVVQGMEFLSALPRGHGKLGFYERPDMNVPIRALHWGPDVPQKDRIDLEILRTDTTLFAQWIEARRNRREEWFHFQAGRVDACNLPVPVRQKPR